MKRAFEIRRRLHEIEDTDLGPFPEEWRVQQRKGWIDALNWAIKTENAQAVEAEVETETETEEAARETVYS